MSGGAARQPRRLAAAAPCPMHVAGMHALRGAAEQPAGGPAHLGGQVVVADDDAVWRAEAAPHLRLALFYLDEVLAHSAARLQAGGCRSTAVLRTARVAAQAGRRRAPACGGSGG